MKNHKHLHFRRFLRYTFFLILLGGFAAAAVGQSANEVLVKFKPGIDQQTIDSINNYKGTIDVEVLADIGVHVIRGAQGQTIQQLIDLYKNDPAVEYVEASPPFKTMVPAQ